MVYDISYTEMEYRDAKDNLIKGTLYLEIETESGPYDAHPGGHRVISATFEPLNGVPELISMEEFTRHFGWMETTGEIAKDIAEAKYYVPDTSDYEGDR